jgi:2-dehydro-3-deoxyglucarate aldolase
MFGTVPDYFAQSNKNITILVQIESQQVSITSMPSQRPRALTGFSLAQAIWLPLDTSAMRLTRKYNALSSIFLPAPKHTANRAAFWLRLKLMPAATWNGARRLSLSAVTSAYSALPRKNWLIPLRNNHP